MAGESKLQVKITKNLELSGWYVFKIILCSKPGMNDLVANKDGKAVYLEVKDKNKKARPLQLHRHTELRNHGMQVFVIDTWECYLQIKYQHL